MTKHVGGVAREGGVEAPQELDSRCPCSPTRSVPDGDLEAAQPANTRFGPTGLQEGGGQGVETTALTIGLHRRAGGAVVGKAGGRFVRPARGGEGQGLVARIGVDQVVKGGRGIAVSSEPRRGQKSGPPGPDGVIHCQPVPEELAEQPMMAIPTVAPLQPHQEEVARREGLQDQLGVRPATQLLAYRSRQSMEHGGIQKEARLLKSDLAEHLIVEIGGRRGRERRPNRCKMAASAGPASEPAASRSPSRPPLGTLRQGDDVVVGHGARRRQSQQLTGFLDAETEVIPDDLRQLAAQPQTVKPEIRFASPGHDDRDAERQAAYQGPEGIDDPSIVEDIKPIHDQYGRG